MTVFVVTQLFEDNDDASILGVFGDFMDAAKVCHDEAEESWENDDRYVLTYLHAYYDKAWFEMFYNGDHTGIYFTIDKTELR
jgi:hypothetical protein